MVDAYAQVAERRELLQRELRRFKGVCYAQLFKVLRLLPDVHKVRDYPGYADAQSVLQSAQRPGPYSEFAAEVHEIRAETLGLHGVYIAAQGLVAEVEVVVAEREAVEPHGVEGRGDGMRFPAVPVLEVELSERRTLERVATVQHKRVPAFFELLRDVEQPAVLRAVARVVHGEDVAVCVRGIVDTEFSCHTQPLASLTRILVDIHSMMSTSTMSPASIAPASSQR